MAGVKELLHAHEAENARTYGRKPYISGGASSPGFSLRAKMFRIVGGSSEYGAFEPNEVLNCKSSRAGRVALCTVRGFCSFTPENRTSGSNPIACSPWGLRNLGSAPCKCLPAPRRQVGTGTASLPIMDGTPGSGVRQAQEKPKPVSGSNCENKNPAFIHHGSRVVIPGLWMPNESRVQISLYET